ncbi:MAG: response regulator [Pseudobacteriovorax sp.]|nr:response regulator [Pseudobacteriovorax sp.]
MGALPKILIVDDDSSFRELLISLLEEDFEIIEAANGSEAEELLASHPVSLVISDYRMPGINGSKLVKAHPELPFIVVSGLDKLPDFPQHVTCFSKPVSYDSLREQALKIVGE